MVIPWECSENFAPQKINPVKGGTPISLKGCKRGGGWEYCSGDCTSREDVAAHSKGMIFEIPKDWLTAQLLLQLFTSSACGLKSARCYQHSLPLFPFRDRIPLRWQHGIGPSHMKWGRLGPLQCVMRATWTCVVPSFENHVLTNTFWLVLLCPSIFRNVDHPQCFPGPVPPPSSAHFGARWSVAVLVQG